MKKRYWGCVLTGLLLWLLYPFYQKYAEAKYQQDLQNCTAKFARLRAEADKLEPVTLQAFQHGSKWGYRDSNNKIVIPARSKSYIRFYEGRLRTIDENWYVGFFDERGHLVIPYKFVYASDFYGGLAAFSGTKEDRYKRGFIDRNGKIVLELKGAYHGYDFTGLKNGRSRVYLPRHQAVPWGFLLPYGNPVPKIYGYVDCTGRVTWDDEE